MIYSPVQHLPWYKGQGGKGLVVYTNAMSVLRRNVERSWLNFMMRKFPGALCLQAPMLMPSKTLEARGHLDRFSGSDQGQVFVCGQLALRPEICQNVYDFYEAKLRKGRRTPILQIGRCARKERTTQGGLNRLAQFTQADVQVIGPGDQLELLRDWAIQWVRQVVRGQVRWILKQDRAHYSLKTYDLQVLMDGTWVEVCSVNDRGKHDLVTHCIQEASFGIDRLMAAILKTGGLPIRVRAQGDSYLELIISDPVGAKEALEEVGFSIQ